MGGAVGVVENWMCTCVCLWLNVSCFGNKCCVVNDIHSFL